MANATPLERHLRVAELEVKEGGLWLRGSLPLTESGRPRGAGISQG